VKLLEAMVEASQEQLGLWDADSTSTHLHSLLAIDLSLYAEIVDSSAM
jgi:hypothetical protein